MRYLGIDYGARRIGLALSDERGGFAFAHATIPTDATAIDRIEKICRKEQVEALVIGDTHAGNGLANSITQEAKDFAKSLAEYCGLPIHEVREAWSSVEASRFAPKGKEHDDAAAAAIILQRFLDTNQGRV